jgi:MOSC domain-containing protein YiiM
MNIQAQGDLPKDPTVLHTIVRESGQHLGIYASVSQPGRVAVGDIVELH